jgi:hypothetical protein
MSFGNIGRDEEYFLGLIRSDLAVYESILSIISRQRIAVIALHNFMIAAACHNRLFLAVNKM